MSQESRAALLGLTHLLGKPEEYEKALAQLRVELDEVKAKEKAAYAAKIELEKSVKRISDARDLPLKEEDKQQERDYVDGMAGAHKVTLVGADPHF